MDFFERVGSTLYHHDFHTPSLEPFWTAPLPSDALHRSPHVAILRLSRYPVVDDVSIVNPDGSETPVESHPAVVDVHVSWENSRSRPSRTSGMTAPTLLPPALVPGGIEPVPQQPFEGDFFVTRAVGSFRGEARTEDGSVLKTFHAVGVASGFAEVGQESIGALKTAPSPTNEHGRSAR